MYNNVKKSLRGIFMFIMKEEYKTGIEFIDKQHGRLFEIANETYLLLKNDYRTDKFDKIVSLIDELKEYSLFHFAAEEAYMEKIGHKKMFTQKMDHIKFIDSIDNLDLRAIDKDQDKKIIDLLKFLNHWFIEHILEKDLLIGK